MDENLKRIKEVIAEGSADEKLSLAEELLAENSPAQAQNVLDSVNERNAKWHFLQSKVFFAKNWVFESKKQMEAALELEPNNILYIEEMERINALGDEQPLNGKHGKPEIDKGTCKDSCAECCAGGCCYCICEGVCEGLGSGC